MANYATQSDVEGILGRSLSATEASALPFLLNAIDQWINDQIGASYGELGDTPATRYYDPERQSSIIDIDPVYVDEDHGLVVSVVDANENVVRTLDVSTYEARPRNENVKTYIQLRNGTKWASQCSVAVANIAVTGYYGFGGTVPADIAYLSAYLAANSIGATKSLSLKSESIEGYSRTFADNKSSFAADSVVSSILDKYTDEVMI